MRKILVLLAITLLAAAANAQVTGSVAAGGQSDDASGGISRFRELNTGEQSGFFLEKLELFGTGDTRFALQSRFTSGKSGFLDLTVDNGPWRGGVRVSRNRAWSGLSFADDVLPSGGSIASLYPYTTALDPLFAEDEPYLDHTRAEAFLTRSIGSASVITIRGGLRQRDGVRVPNFGAFAFGDSGTASFFAPGLEDIDSSSSWTSLEARTAIRNVALRVEAGAMQRENRTDYAMPAYGEDALLDLNHWNERTDADTKWLRATGAYSHRLFSIEGGASRFETSADIAGRDFRTNRDGLRVDRGRADTTVTSGGLGTTIQLGRRATLALSSDVQSRENDGDGNVFLRTTSVGNALTELASDRVGSTADLRIRFGKSTRLRVRGRVTTTESDVRETLAAYDQDLTRETTRTEFRTDLATRFTKQVRGRAWGRIGQEEQKVDLRTLDNGFTVGDSDRSDVGGGLELAFAGGRQSTLLSVSAARTDFENSEPYFDPVFDPSSILFVAEGHVSNVRATASSVWSFASESTPGSVWGEVGWLSTEYRFDDTVEHAGFRWLDESVQGIVVALGGEMHPRESLRVIANAEWVRDEEDLDRTLGRTLTRGSIELAQMLRNNIEVFGRWTTSDLDAPRSLTDEFNVDLFAIGVRTKF
jgi:hypothetical protein